MTTKASSFPKVPPQSIEAEESLISAILIDNSVLPEVVQLLSPPDFYKPAHQKIFSAVVELFRRSEPVDMVTLADKLSATGRLKEIGGAAYLASLVENVPLAINAPYYAKIIHNKACLRRLIEKASSIAERSFEEQGDVDDILNFAENAVFEISKNRIKPSFFPIGKLIDKTVTAIDQQMGSKSLVTGVSTGFTLLDSQTAGLQNSDLIILAARPSMGKTALALNIARNAAETGTPVAFFSLEMSKEQLSMRMLAAEARTDSFRLRSGFIDDAELRKITDAADRLSDLPLYIDDSPSITAMEIRAKARRLSRDHGLGLIIVDYLQLMRGTANTERRDLEISEISRSLKIMAKELNVPVIALSQLNRKVEERHDKRPLLSDLRESGSLEQDADVVMFIYRDEVYNKDENNPNRGKAEIIISKQRNGPIGTVVLAFINAYTRFENLAQHF